MVEHRLAKARVASSNLVSRLPKTLENTMFSRVFAFLATCRRVIKHIVYKPIPFRFWVLAQEDYEVSTGVAITREIP